jgi:hypothetical protein
MIENKYKILVRMACDRACVMSLLDAEAKGSESEELPLDNEKKHS